MARDHRVMSNKIASQSDQMGEALIIISPPLAHPPLYPEIQLKLMG